MVAKKDDLAVLHNRNKMVNTFATTEWVALLAQTTLEFLSGERGKSFHQLPPQAAQKEEVFARTRA